MAKGTGWRCAGRINSAHLAPAGAKPGALPPMGVSQPSHEMPCNRGWRTRQTGWLISRQISHRLRYENCNKRKAIPKNGLGGNGADAVNQPDDFVFLEGETGHVDFSKVILVDRWGCALLVVFEKRAHETLDVSFSSQKGFIRSAQCSRNNHFRPRQES